MTIKVKVLGVKGTQRALVNVGGKASTRAMRAGVTAGANPQVKALRARLPVDGGPLRKATTKKVKQYRRGAIVLAIIGARNRRIPSTRKKGGVQNPALYFHLVDQGAKAHSIPGPVAFRSGDRLIVTRNVQHPGVQGAQYAAAAARASTSQAQGEFNRKFKAKLEAEAKKGAT